LSSTFVPVASVWLLKHAHGPGHHESSGHHVQQPKTSLFDRMRGGYERLLAGLIGLRLVLIPVYLVVCGLVIVSIFPRLGHEIFPVINTGAFRLRLRAPDGTHIAKSEQYAKEALDIVADTVGPENVDLSVGY